MREDWEIKRWEDVLEIRSGRNQKDVENPDGKYPIYGSGGTIMNYADDYLCEEGTTIIGRKGTIDNPLFIETKFWNVDTAFGLVAGQKLDKRYLYYFCLSFDFTSRDKGTTLPSLVKKDLKKIKIPIPPLPEQKRIVAMLDEAFEAIDQAKANIEQNIENAEELFQSKLNEIFSQRGEGWEEISFDDAVSDTQIGLVRNKKQQNPSNEYRYFKMDNIKNSNGIDETSYERVDADNEEVQKYKLLKGDFLFNTRNSHELVGKSCVYNSESDETTLFNNNILRARFKEDLDSSFIGYNFCSKPIKEQLESFKSGTTSVVGIYYKALKNLKIRYPSLEEQKSITIFLDSLRDDKNTLVNIYRNKLESIEELKKSILQKAFSGELTANEHVAA